MKWIRLSRVASAVLTKDEVAKIKFLRLQSSFNNNEEFLVAGKDHTVIEFEVSGNNSVHTFKGINGPQFYYTTTDGVSHKGCMGFDPDTGSCITRKGVRDACSSTATAKAVRNLGDPEYTKVLIGIGVVALMAIVAGLGLIIFNKYGCSQWSADEANDRTFI
ncbi:hypothetical protein RRG08_057464 [Elysia crispata]|uniref:Uncharacterized protein n=1 Tax=Elysia crispata TaxID=231223 RepID=A0AAE1D9F7_9GAST|nr:hypothetical protein RRG08_057464 [Elysia crispata]